MPITPQDKKALLDKYGVDSNKYWVNDEGDIIDMPSDGNVMAGVKSAALNIPRTLAGFGGAAVGAAGAGALGLPSGPGAIATGLAGATAGGMAGGALGEAFQNAVYPEDWLLAQQARQVRTPRSAMIGDAAASLALMRPSVRDAVNIGRGLKDLTRGAAQFGMRPERSAALVNSGIGAMMGAGTTIGQGGGAEEIALNTLMGAAQTRPTWLGQKVSGGVFMPGPDGAPTLRESVDPASLRVPEVPVDAPMQQSDAMNKMRDQLLKQQQNKYTRSFEEELAKMAANDAAMVRQQAVQAAMGRLDTTGAPVAEGTMPPRTSQFNPEPPTRRVTDLPLNDKGQPTFTIRGEEPFAGSQIPLEPTGAFERGVPTQPGRPAPRADIPRDLRPVDERIAGARPLEGTPAERRAPFAPAAPRAAPRRAVAGEPGFLDQEAGVRPSGDWNAWWSNDMARLDDVLVKFGKPTNEAGADVAGVTMPTRDPVTGKREIGINERAYTDTLPHERAHGLILDVLQHGRPGEKAKMRRLLEQAGVPEETLVQGVGEDVVRRFLDRTSDKWRDDFGAFMRTKFGRGTETTLRNDARRVLSGIMMHGGGSAKVLRGYKPAGVVNREVAPDEAAPVERPAEPAFREPELADDGDTYTPNRDPQRYTNPVDEGAQVRAEARTAREEAARVRRAEDFTRARQEEDAQAPEVVSATRSNPPAPRSVGSVRRGSDRVMRGLTPEDIMPGSDVSRPEAREVTAASNSTNMRRGKNNADNARTSADDLDARRIEASLSGEERPRYQPFREDSPFATDFEKELGKPRPWNVQVAKDGRMAATDIKAAVAKMNPTEQELLKSGGLDEYLKRVIRPNAEQLREWAAENLPRVEVKELGVDGGSKNQTVEQFRQQEASAMHELDTKFPGWYSSEYFDATHDIDFSTHKKYKDNPEFLTLIQTLTSARAGVVTADYTYNYNRPNDSATRNYDSASINPRQLKDMSGAVDLLVRLPRGKSKSISSVRRINGKDAMVSDDPLYSSSHYPQSGDNLLAHVRAYEHTMPDGERVLRVFELQSDWAQDRRKQEARDSRVGERGDEAYGDVADHPLLPHHQRLALKAAIEHARKRGIKRVVIDDAETAMLTEGHDKAVVRVLKNTPDNIKALSVLGDERSVARLQEEGELKWRNMTPEDAKEIKAAGGTFTESISQEKGMRLAYDQVLNQMMRDLSGDGVKVEMGEHRNAFNEQKYAESSPEIQAELRELIRRRGREELTHDEFVELRAQLVDKPKPRPDLIFRNPDGTPKTQSSGVAYDTSAAQARRDAGEPFSYAGRKYQTFGPNVPDRTYGATPAAEGRRNFSLFESASQAAARSSNPNVRHLGARLTELFPAQRAMQGRYRALPEAFERLNERDSDILIRHLIDEDRAGRPNPAAMPTRLQGAYNSVRSTLRQMRTDQIAAGQPRNDGGTPGTDPAYMFNVVDPSVRKTLRDEVDSPRYAHLRDAFVDFNAQRLQRTRNLSASDAADQANEFFNRYRANVSRQAVDGSFDFGAVTLPAGSKLPDSWLHADPGQAARQYVRDWSRARTFHDIVRTDDRAMAALGQAQFYRGGALVDVTAPVNAVSDDANIKHLLNESLGINTGSSDTVSGALGRAASTLWLANPITRSVDIATSAFKALGYVRPQHIPGLIANLQTFGRSIRNAQDTGWVKRDGNTIVGEVLGAGEAFSNGIDKFSKGVTKFTGSEALENFGRTLAQNTGEYIGRTNRALASAGDARATEFLNRISSDWATLSEAELGTRIGQLFQGKYDATNLPKWLSDSPIAPFMSLSRWNIEQWNNFREMAINPARRGDVQPLITMLVAGTLGGLGIKEIREALGGRKSNIATIKELQEAPEGSPKYQEAVRYLGNLVQLTGTMGIVSEMSNMALTAAAKDKPQAPTMPAYEVVTDLVPRGVAAARAIADGEDPLTVLKQLGRDIGNEHASFYRFTETNLGRAGVFPNVKEDLADAASRRDLRVGKRLRGEDVRSAPNMPIDYSRADERAVERLRDPQEMRAAARELRTKIKQIPDKAERAKRMASAASSRVSYMPSKANDPKAYRDQMDFVRRTQGDAKAEELRLRYIRDTKNADWRRGTFK